MEEDQSRCVFFFVSLLPLPLRLYLRVWMQGTADMIHFEKRTIGASRINLSLLSVSLGCDATAFHSHPHMLTPGPARSFILPRARFIFTSRLLYLFSWQGREMKRKKKKK